MIDLNVYAVIAEKLNTGERIPIPALEPMLKTINNESLYGYGNIEVDSGNYIKAKTTNEWEQDGSTVYPAGIILIYTDRTFDDGVPMADMKITDGNHSVNDLPFYNSNQTISDNDTDPLQLVGTVGSESKLQRSTSVYVQGGTIHADAFEGAATQVSNPLVIGDIEYNGSEQVNIPIYKGE